MYGELDLFATKTSMPFVGTMIVKDDPANPQLFDYFLEPPLCRDMFSLTNDSRIGPGRYSFRRSGRI